MSLHRFKQLADGSILDLTTGELLGGEGNKGSFVFVRSIPKIREGWFMFFQKGSVELAKDKDISWEAYRVFHILLGKLDFENYILIPQNEVAQELDMKKQNVSRAIKKLVDKGILIKGEKLGKTYSYKLNSYYGWKGKVINLFDEEQNIKKPKLIVDNTESVKDEI